jgi:hypothetical protein
MPCATCGKPETLCVCDRLEPRPTRVRVLVLQHPQEPDHLLGTAPLLARGLERARVVVGLSWASLSDALGEEVPPGRWSVLWRGSSTEPGLFDRNGNPARADNVDGIVVLDGTWTQAKTLWWRNPWLLKLGRIVLQPGEPTIYGKLRKSPNRWSVSTLEAVAEALVLLGEDPERRAELRRAMRTMCQRARDAGTANEA